MADTARAGTMARPACSGVRPMTCCRKIGTMNWAPNRPRLLKNAVVQMRPKAGCLNSRRLTAGKAASSSRNMKPAPPSNAPTPSSTSIDVSTSARRPRLMSSSRGIRKPPRLTRPG